MMKNFTFHRAVTAAAAVAGFAFAICAQSFTVHFKNGNTQTFNHADVDCISFSPESYEPGSGETFTFTEPANTYIVSRAGDYEFYPKHVSGTDIEGVVKADWIWAQKLDAADTEQALISDVRLEDGMVRFTATGNYGNAAVAGFDDAGKVVWVWLIWMTPTPEDNLIEGDNLLIDRFMGATGATKEAGKKAWGVIVYQWGRPVPIFGGFEDEWDENGETFNEARKWTVMNPEYGFEWKVEKRAVSFEEAIATPTTFFTLNAKWLDVENRDLWGAEKTDNDPSPAGYKIPCAEQWGENYMDNLEYMEDESGVRYNYNGNYSWFPAGNQNRMYDTGENVVGYPGYMCWNAEYRLDDFLGVLDNPQFKDYTIEELIAMGLIRGYFPTRLSINCNPDAMQGGTKALANSSFGFPIRCIRINK